MAERDYVKFCENFNVNWVFDFKTDLKRKLLHLFTVFIIFFFWFLGTILENIGYLAKWGLDNYSFSLWLIITIGYGFVIMFQIADLARLNYFYALPKWAKNWYCKQMRSNELETFIASTPMVLAFVFFVFAPFPIFAAVSLITAGSDAIAALIGKKCGKHKFKKNSKKTLEGFLAGGFTTFFIVLIISLIFRNLLPQNIALIKILLMAIVSTIIFLLIDGFTTDINDNILNPILTGLGLWIVLLI
jgi:dolichol kinase